MQGSDVAIVGAGIMGAATACELARNGAKVTLIDQSFLPNPLAASVDHSKVFRFAYPEQFYVKLAVDALKRWRELESETGSRLLTKTGALLLGRRRPSFELDCYDAMRWEGLEAQLLDSQAVAERFPQFNADAFAYGVVDPAGAILHAELALGELLELARRRGVQIISEERVEGVSQPSGSKVELFTDAGREIVCEQAVIASGPWTRKLLPFLEAKLKTTRQELAYFEPIVDPDRLKSAAEISFEPDRFPIFLELDSGFYGFPVHNSGAMKIANHNKGSEVNPYSALNSVGESFIESCRAFFAEFIPALANARVCETRVCIYNNTPDDDFIIDWHPEMDRVLLVTGFSGHGFKFAPAIGHIAAVLISGDSSINIDRFRLTRFCIQ